MINDESSNISIDILHANMIYIFYFEHFKCYHYILWICAELNQFENHIHHKLNI